MNNLYLLLINLLGTIIAAMIKAKTTKSSDDADDQELIADNHNNRNTFYKLLRLKRHLENRLEKR